MRADGITCGIVQQLRHAPDGCPPPGMLQQPPPPHFCPPASRPPQRGPDDHDPSAAAAVVALETGRWGPAEGLTMGGWGPSPLMLKGKEAAVCRTCIELTPRGPRALACLQPGGSEVQDWEIMHLGIGTT